MYYASIINFNFLKNKKKEIREKSEIYVKLKNKLIGFINVFSLN
jgi:hypothetical protein